MLAYTSNGVSVELIRLAQRGDMSAFAELVQIGRRRVMGAVSRLISRPDDVEDVTQEVFLRMYASIGQLHTPEAYDLWLWRITTNAAYDYLRKRPRRQELRVSDLRESQVDAAEHNASCKLDREERDRLRLMEYVDGLLAQLAPTDRILIVMREVEGMSMEELAAVLGISVGAVKVRLFRARNRMRSVLEPAVEPRRVSVAVAVTP